MRGGIRKAGDKERGVEYEKLELKNEGWNRKSWRQRMRGVIGKAGDKE